MHGVWSCVRISHHQSSMFSSHKKQTHLLSQSLHHYTMTTNSLIVQEKPILDSLPYVETVHEDYEDYALALIEEEMQQSNPRAFAKPPTLKFRSPMMEQEYRSLVVNNEYVPREGTSFQPRKIAKPDTAAEFVNAINEAKTRYEAERIRGIVLEAEKGEAAENWKDFNNSLERQRLEWSNALQKQSEIVEEINYQRQQAQINQFGPQLEQLNLEYQQALYRINQLKYAMEADRRRN